MSMKTRRVVGTILIILAIAFTASLSVVMVQRINSVVLKDRYIDVFRRELIACAIFLLFALDVRFGLLTRMKAKSLRAAGWCLRVVVICVTVVMLFFVGKVAVGSFIRTAAPANYAIVLGMALENGKPNSDLLSRLDTAEAYLSENPEATLILTGGNPDESGRTEAAAMGEILTERGVPAERMILEDQARDTRSNFRNVAQLIDPTGPVVLVSSNYHMDRAVRTARRAGFTRVLRLPAPSSIGPFAANVMWEVFMEVNEMTRELTQRLRGANETGASPKVELGDAPVYCIA